MKKISFIIIISFIINSEAMIKNNEVLPEFLKPLKWGITESELKKIYPNLTVTYNKCDKLYKGKMKEIKSTNIENINLNIFNKAIVSIEYLKSEIITYDIYTDRRNIKGDSRYSKDLENIYKEIYKLLKKEYGKPLTEQMPEGVYDIRSKETTWKTDSYEFALFIDGGEDDYWQVQLNISKL